MLLTQIARAAGGRTIGRKLLGLGVPLVAALIHDMKQPQGYIRPFLNRIMHGRPTIRIIDAQHTSIEDTTKENERLETKQVDQQRLGRMHDVEKTSDTLNKGKDRTPK